MCNPLLSTRLPFHCVASALSLGFWIGAASRVRHAARRRGTSRMSGELPCYSSTPGPAVLAECGELQQALLRTAHGPLLLGVTYIPSCKQPPSLVSPSLIGRSLVVTSLSLQKYVVTLALLYRRAMFRSQECKIGAKAGGRILKTLRPSASCLVRHQVQRQRHLSYPRASWINGFPSLEPTLTFLTLPSRLGPRPSSSSVSS